MTAKPNPEPRVYEVEMTDGRRRMILEMSGVSLLAAQQAAIDYAFRSTGRTFTPLRTADCGRLN